MNRTLSGKKNFDMHRLPEFDDHELILRFEDKKTGLKGFVAIHNTRVGPAVGGTRFCYYENEEGALRDALRLSRAMTYKCALANVPYGGGKAVLMAPQDVSAGKKLKTKQYLAAYAKNVDLLGGHFYTGEDVGMTEQDIKMLARLSTHIIGRPSHGGLPAHWAALSVHASMLAALKAVFGSESFVGRTVLIKGLGNVGFDLAKMLLHERAIVIGAETNPARIERARKLKGLTLVSDRVIHTLRADIFSPCALGGDLSQKTIPQLKVKIVCGAANNQLATPEDGARLFKRGITYVPDYIANGGGLINVVDELHPGGYSRTRVERDVQRVRSTVGHLLAESRKRREAPDAIADRSARRRFA